MSRSSFQWALVLVASAWILFPQPVQAQRPRFTVGGPIPIDAGGAGPQGVALGDVNRDGRIDIVVVSIDEEDGPLAVLINDGNGSFSAPRFVNDEELVLGDPVAIAVADVGAPSGGPDGNPDIIVIDLDGGFLVVFGDGSGNFTVEGDLAELEGLDSPIAVAVADFDGQNGLDLAIVDEDGANNNGEVFFLCNIGQAGGFEPCNTVALGTGGAEPFDAGSGDFNGDGQVDIVVLNRGGAAGEGNLALLTGNGGGTFSIPRQATFLIPRVPQDLAVANLNPDEDSISDAVVVDNDILGEDNVSVFFGGTTGAFLRARGAILELGTTSIALGNFVGATNIDLAGSNDGDLVDTSFNISVAAGSGANVDPPFDLNPQIAGQLPEGAIALVAGRLNEDDLDDLVALNLPSDDPDAVRAIRIALNASNLPTETPGTPSPGSPTVPPTPTPTRVVTPSLEACTVPLAIKPIAMAQGDLDGNGSPDLAVASETGGQLLVMLTDSDRLAGPDAPCDYPRTVPYTLQSELGRPNIANVVVGDLNRDSRPDIVVVASDGVWILVASGDRGSFALPRRLDVTTSDPRSVAVQDLNGGGIVDLAVANHGDGTVTVLFGLGDNGVSFEQQPETQPPLSVAGALIVVAANLNEDSRPDLAVASDADDTVRIFLQGPAGSVLFPTPTPPAQVPTVDLSDRDPVAMVAAQLTSSPLAQLVVVMQNALGVGAFGTVRRVGSTFSLSPLPLLSTGRNPSSVAVGDFVPGGDRHDAAVTSVETGSVSFFAGTSDGFFTAAGDSKVGDAPMSVVGGDFDQDGHDDLAVANLDSGNLTLLLSSRVPPTPSPTITVTVGPSNTATATGTPGPSLTATRGTPAATSTPKDGTFELSSCSIAPMSRDQDGASAGIACVGGLLWWARRNRKRSRSCS